MAIGLSDLVFQEYGDGGLGAGVCLLQNSALQMKGNLLVRG